MSALAETPTIKKRVRSSRSPPRVPQLLADLRRIGRASADRVTDGHLARLCAAARRWRFFEVVATAAWTFVHVQYDSASAEALARTGWLSLVAQIAADAIAANNPDLAQDAVWALRVAETDAEEGRPCRCNGVPVARGGRRRCAACDVRAAKASWGLAAVWPLGMPPGDAFRRLCAVAAANDAR